MLPERSLSPIDASTPDSELVMEERPQDTSGGSKTSLSQNLGISAVTVALFLLLRIFAVSKWDWGIASDVAETVDLGSAPTLALGTLFAEPNLTAVFVMLLLPLMIIDLVWSQSSDLRHVVSSIMSITVFGSVAVILTLTQGTWWLPVGAILIAALVVVLYLAWRHSAAQRAAQQLLTRVGLVAILGVLVLAATISTPWTALERIETKIQTINGHVLETPSGYLKVLDVETGRVVILISSDVISREIESD